jgi:hypothetical protein
MIKNSNGRIVSEKEKLELENKELIIKDITGCECQKETTKKIAKNKKRIKELEKDDLIDATRYVVETALQDKENADGTIEETISAD